MHGQNTRNMNTSAPASVHRCQRRDPEYQASGIGPTRLGSKCRREDKGELGHWHECLAIHTHNLVKEYASTGSTGGRSSGRE